MQISPIATKPDVCPPEKQGVTLCPCGQPARRRFCSNACRQAAHRSSDAHATNLKRLRDARAARRAAYELLKNGYDARRNVYRSFTTTTGIFGGPTPSGVPSVRIGDLDLKDYLTEKDEGRKQ
jgi:hypothetical protein